MNVCLGSLVRREGKIMLIVEIRNDDHRVPYLERWGLLNNSDAGLCQCLISVRPRV